MHAPTVARAFFAALVIAAGAGTPAQAASSATTDVYLVQGVAGSTTTFTVDGARVSKDSAAKTVVGPLKLTPGKHVVASDSTKDSDDVSATIDVPASGSIDVVVHRQVNPKLTPVFTTYVNDLSPIAADSGRLAVAHTAAVGPADIRVDDKVLFANVANGEALSLTVPARTYSVQIVPTATTGPAVLGPVDLPVAKNELTRVFAIGAATNDSMDAIVHCIHLPSKAAGEKPARIETGNGGQAQGLIAASRSEDGGVGAGAVTAGGALVAAGGAFVARRRRAQR